MRASRLTSSRSASYGLGLQRCQCTIIPRQGCPRWSARACGWRSWRPRGAFGSEGSIRSTASAPTRPSPDQRHIWKSGTCHRLPPFTERTETLLRNHCQEDHQSWPAKGYHTRHIAEPLATDGCYASTGRRIHQKTVSRLSGPLSVMPPPSVGVCGAKSKTVRSWHEDPHRAVSRVYGNK
jgi:hypothetical protein